MSYLIDRRVSRVILAAAVLVASVAPRARAQGVPQEAPAGAGVVRLANGSPIATPATVGNLTYHGGPVQHRQKVFQVFWNPSGTVPFPAGYQTTINQFVQDLSASPYYAVGHQYSDSTGNIDNDVLYGGTWLDTVNAIPNDPPSVLDLADEVNRAIAANSWATDANSYVEVYTPSGYGLSANFCGFHVIGSSVPFGLILFPASHGSLGTCIPEAGPFPNGQIVDHAIDVSAHEIMETVTDPFGTGWFFVNGAGEIGDECNFKFGSTRAADGSNVTISGHHYLVQQEWSNAVSGCTLSTPLVTITANGQDGPLMLPPGSSLTIAISANGGDGGFANPEDLYLGLSTPSGVIWLTPTGATSTPTPAFSGPLPTFGPTTLVTLPNVSVLPSGSYAWFIVVNGSTGLFFDVVQTIIE